MEFGNHRLNKRDKLTLGAVGLLQVALIAAKIGGNLSWHWMVVLLPTELVMGLFVLIVVVSGIIILLKDD